jgi:hypothetical protein
MKYITGVHALNLPCSLDTSGDWHTSWIQWESPKTKDTESSFWGDWGIEYHSIPEHEGAFPVANHIRACFDMLEDGDFSNLQGMNKDYICNDEYDEFIFQQVSRLKGKKNWANIDKFMEKEYLMKWIRYQEAHAHDKAEAVAN